MQATGDPEETHIEAPSAPLVCHLLGQKTGMTSRGLLSPSAVARSVQQGIRGRSNTFVRPATSTASGPSGNRHGSIMTESWRCASGGSRRSSNNWTPRAPVLPTSAAYCAGGATVADAPTALSPHDGVLSSCVASWYLSGAPPSSSTPRHPLQVYVAALFSADIKVDDSRLATA